MNAKTCPFEAEFEIMRALKNLKPENCKTLSHIIYLQNGP